MRTGRNLYLRKDSLSGSLDHWDMRTGRNLGRLVHDFKRSLDHWDMRTGRNSSPSAVSH